MVELSVSGVELEAEKKERTERYWRRDGVTCKYGLLF
jgi:hypothetical protein